MRIDASDSVKKCITPPKNTCNNKKIGVDLGPFSLTDGVRLLNVLSSVPSFGRISENL